MTDIEKTIHEKIKDAKLMVKLEKEALITLKEFLLIGLESEETIRGQEQQLREAEIYLKELLRKEGTGENGERKL